MEVRILGTLEVLVDGRQVALGGARQRAVLAILALHRGEAVSVDRIVDELWGDRSPEKATKTVQVYVSRLRKALGEGVLITRGGGYALEVGPENVDAERFERLAAEGRAALDTGDPTEAAERLREALALWRGPPLADLAYESFTQNEVGRLEDLRLGALEDRVEADLALGRHAALVPELEGIAAEHPTRERLRGQLMLALYRSGRQSEALESYRDAQRTLAAELGLEPSPELQRLERAILDQDPAIRAPPRRGPIADLRHGRRAGLVVAFGGGLLLAAAVAAIVAVGDEPDSQLAEANALAAIDPASNRVIDTVPTGIDPADVSADAEHVWVANRGDNSVTEVDPEAKTVLGTTSAETRVGGMTTGAGGVWIADSRGEKLVRLDPDFPSAARSIRLAPRPADLDFVAVNPVAAGQGAVWVPCRQWRDRARPAQELPDSRHDPRRQHADLDRHGRRQRLGRRRGRQLRHPDRPGARQRGHDANPGRPGSVGDRRRRGRSLGREHAGRHHLANRPSLGGGDPDDRGGNQADRRRGW